MDDLEQSLSKGRKNLGFTLGWAIGTVIFGLLPFKDDIHRDPIPPKSYYIDSKNAARPSYWDSPAPHKEVPSLGNTVRIQVVGNSHNRNYDVEVDFEDLMYQLGIEPEDLVDFIGER